MHRRAFLAATLGAAVGRSLRAAPSLGTIAYVEYDGLTVRTLPDGEPRKVLRAPVRRPRFSPSGKWIHYEQNETSFVVSIDGGTVRKVGDVAEWSPVADELWAEDSDGLQLFSPRNVWSAPLATIAGATLGVFHPDGSEMVYTSVEQTSGGDELCMVTNLCRVALKDGARPSILATTGGDWTVCLWTRDGKSIVYWAQDDFSASEASDGNQLFVMPASGEKARALGVVTLLDHDLVALSPNRLELAVTAGEGRYEWINKRLAVVALETASVRYLTSEDTVGFSPVWSPDGNRIAYCAGPQPLKEADVEFGGDEGNKQVNAMLAKRRIWIRDRAGAQAARLLTSDDRYHDREPLWSADGSHILFTRSDSPLNDIESLSSDRQTLWLAGQDGSNPIQVTGELYIDSDIGGPDERRAAFDWLR
jgi:hypothetical protein